MTIKVDLETGELEQSYDGHLYNGHIIWWSKVTNVEDEDEVMEIEASCLRCGRYENVVQYSKDPRRTWTIYAWLVGQFDEECDNPKKDIERAAKNVIKKYSGKPATGPVTLKMKDEIRERVGSSDMRIQFV